MVLVLALAGCGGSIAPGGAGTLTAAAEATGTPTERPPTPTPAPLDCGPELAAFVEKLADLDSRLTIGLTFADYGERVGDANVAHDRILVTDLSLDCLNVGVDAEHALQAYVDAHTTWNDCIQDPACSNDSITTELQAKWAEATELIEKAQRALE